MPGAPASRSWVLGDVPCLKTPKIPRTSCLSHSGLLTLDGRDKPRPIKNSLLYTWLLTRHHRRREWGISYPLVFVTNRTLLRVRIASSCLDKIWKTFITNWIVVRSYGHRSRKIVKRTSLALGVCDVFDVHQRFTSCLSTIPYSADSLRGMGSDVGIFWILSSHQTKSEGIALGLFLRR